MNLKQLYNLYEKLGGDNEFFTKVLVQLAFNFKIIILLAIIIIEQG